MDARIVTYVGTYVGICVGIYMGIWLTFNELLCRFETPPEQDRLISGEAQLP
jgi:hypothetical protein